MVGYIEANGAGKSTTIKMLSGILVPTSGSIEVNGKAPFANRKENARRIGVVFGQRSQLYWDLTMEDTFGLFQKIYKIDPLTFKRNIEFFVELLDMKEYLQRPVRQLSLGEKMKANLAVALLHDPQILYLDEPTIGLDIVAKSKMRSFITELLSVIKDEGNRKWFMIDKQQITVVEALAILSLNNKVLDLSIKEPNIEDMVKKFYEPE